MNPNSHNPIAHESSSTEETLRLIASLPAPDGLEERVHAALRAVPDPQQQALIDEGSRRGRVLAWPSTLHGQSGWMRTAAAAAIVFVVVGGGWGIYSHVERGQAARVVVMPPHVPASGFSSAGAMRTPETVPGPVLTHPSKPQEAQPEATKKPLKHVKPAEAAHSRPAATASPAIQAGASK